jgi:hypothetical protein
MTDRLRVGVCGGGHLAHACAAVLGVTCRVSVLTRHPAPWQPSITAVYRDLVLTGQIDRVSSDPADVAADADVLLVTVPANAHRDVLTRIAPWLRPGTWVGALPGGGGFDWTAGSILGRGARIFGVQRAPYNCRIRRVGGEVEITGIRDEIRVAALPSTEVTAVATLLEGLLNIRTAPLGSYLAVTLAPANPALHAARLYGLWRDWDGRAAFDHVPKFYAEWDEVASRMYLGVDADIQRICTALPVDLRSVDPILRHYRLSDPAQLTPCIRTIESLRSLDAPMVAGPDGYRPDLGARHFQEDVPCGLAVMRGIGELIGVPTPTIDHLIAWAQDMLGRSYLVGDRLRGADARGLALPWNFGIRTVDDLVEAARR